VVAGLLTLLRTCAGAYCRQANEKEHVTKKDKAKAKAKHKQGKKQEKDKREEKDKKDKVHELLVDEVAGVEDVVLSCSPTTHTPFIAVENVPCCESSDRNQNRSDASCSAFQAVLTTQQKVIAGLSHFAAPAAAERSSLPVFYQQTSKNHSCQLARSLS
jgi:hypothetical protein